MQVVLDRLYGGIIGLLGLGIYVYAQDFPQLPEGYPGPGLFPQIIALALLLAGVSLLVRSFLKNASASREETGGYEGSGMRLLLGIVIVAVYPLLYSPIAPLQYSLGIPFSPMLVVLGLQVFGLALLTRVPIKSAILAAILSPICIYVLFTRLLGVSL